MRSTDRVLILNNLLWTTVCWLLLNIIAIIIAVMETVFLKGSCNANVIRTDTRKCGTFYDRLDYRLIENKNLASAIFVFPFPVLMARVYHQRPYNYNQ